LSLNSLQSVDIDVAEYERHHANDNDHSYIGRRKQDIQDATTKQEHHSKHCSIMNDKQ